MTSFGAEMESELARIREAGLHRVLRCVDSPQGASITIAGQTLANFSSNDYLALANHPILKEAAVRAVERFGTGSGASRLICGSLRPHQELEAALASFKGTQAALAFSSGYATAIGTICALLSRRDTIILDKLVHASIVDAARLSGAKIRVFPHNNVEGLERLLRSVDLSAPSSAPQRSRPRALIVVESVYSMDGDLAPLREIVALKDRYGAWLMVDEAHATGVLGVSGRGLAEQLGVSDRIEIQMGTLGKALGSSGGFICGSSSLIDFLVNRARSFIFSTAPVPAAAAAATAALQLLQSDEGRQRRTALWERIGQAEGGRRKSEVRSPKSEREELEIRNPKSEIRNKSATKEIEKGKDALLEHSTRSSAIIPIMIGDEGRTVKISEDLRERGFLIPAIRYPTVARGKARLRLTLTAAHEEAGVAAVLDALWRAGI